MCEFCELQYTLFFKLNHPQKNSGKSLNPVAARGILLKRSFRLWNVFIRQILHNRYTNIDLLDT